MTSNRLVYAVQTLILYSVLLIPFTVHGLELNGRVLNVSSGLSFVLRTEEGAFKSVRLAGLSSPLNHPRMSNVTRQHLAMLIAGKSVAIEYTRLTPDGEILGYVRHGGADINLRMITDGMAWLDEVHKLDPKRTVSYRAALGFAKKYHLGMWK